jgi:flagellar protein FlaG
MAADIKIHQAGGTGPITQIGPVTDRRSPVQRFAQGSASSEKAASRTTTDSGRYPPQLEQITSAIDQLNDFLERTKRELRFSIDQANRRMVISVYNAVTHELVRQIPPQEVVALAELLEEAEFTTTGVDALV